MQYSTNFNLNKPERADQYNLDHWNGNTDIIDNELNALRNITDNTLKTALLNFCYPIGSLYWSSKRTNPASLFGGTWVQIKDRFVLPCGDIYISSGAAGGASTVTLSVDNMPSHNHTFTPSGTVSNHSHSFTPSGTISSHNHSFLPSGRISGFTLGVVARWKDRLDGDSGVSVTQVVSDGDFGGGGGRGGIYDKIIYSPTFTGTQKNTDTVQQSFTGNTASTSMDAPTFAGTSGTTSSSGSGASFSIMPSYIIKYCWERMA